MENNNTTYRFDPATQTLTIVSGGKLAGGFAGRAAEREFHRLLETGVTINITDMSDSLKNARVKRLRALWIKQGIDQYRDAILEPYGVSSTADLNLLQLDELIARYSNKSEPTARTRSLRSDVLTTLNNLGVYSTNDDWQRVNAYLMQPRIAGKLLYQMSDDELIALNRKLRSILTKRLNEDPDLQRQQMLN